jgi:hypothetical protein
MALAILPPPTKEMCGSGVSEESVNVVEVFEAVIGV